MRLWPAVHSGPSWVLTPLGVVSLANRDQVFQFISCRYCWCTCSPRPYTLALGSRVENCRNWLANRSGPMLESNLDANAKCRDRGASGVDRTRPLRKVSFTFGWLNIPYLTGPICPSVMLSHRCQEIRTSFSLGHPTAWPKYYPYYKRCSVNSYWQTCG